MNKTLVVAIIIVFVMILLVVGIGFIRGMFYSEPPHRVIFDDLKEVIIKDLIRQDENVLLSRTVIAIGRRQSTPLFLGIRNKRDEQLHYKIVIVPISMFPSDEIDDKSQKSFNIDTQEPYDRDMPLGFTLDDEIYTLPANESSVKKIILGVTNITQYGLYLLRFDIVDIDTNKNYAEKDFFVKVENNQK